MAVELTQDQLLYFAERLLWAAAFAGVLGSMAFGAIVRVLCWCIASLGSVISRRNRIYVARIRARALERTRNG